MAQRIQEQTPRLQSGREPRAENILAAARRDSDGSLVGPHLRKMGMGGSVGWGPMRPSGTASEKSKIQRNLVLGCRARVRLYLGSYFGLCLQASTSGYALRHLSPHTHERMHERTHASCEQLGRCDGMAGVRGVRDCWERPSSVLGYAFIEKNPKAKKQIVW